MREVLGRLSRVGELCERADGASKGGVVRFDLALPGTCPHDAPKGLWLDHAIVHETSLSYQAKVLEFLRSDEVGGPGGSFPFVKVVAEKLSRFKGVMEVAGRLSGEGVLGFQPSFLFPVVSSLGYANGDMTKLTTWLVSRFLGEQRSLPPQGDGVSLKELGGRYKLYLKRALCFGVLRGSALALYSQGRAEVCRPPY